MTATPHSNVSTCTKSLKLLADFWILRIIESLTGGEQRFCEIQRAVGNVNPATLTKKLGELEDARLVARTEEKDGVAVYYRLTDLGQGVLPVLHAINQFSRKFEKTH